LTEALKGLVMRFRKQFTIENPDRRLLFEVEAAGTFSPDAGDDVSIMIENCNLLEIWVEMQSLSYTTMRRRGLTDSWEWFAVALPEDAAAREELNRRFVVDYDEELTDAIYDSLTSID